MNQLAIWSIKDNISTEIPLSQINYEKELETILENNPKLIEPGFNVLSRQLHISSGIIDLLGLDMQGRFCIVEIKRGSLFREVVAQAIDYASEISSMPFKQLKEKIQYNLSNTIPPNSLNEILKEKSAQEEESNDSREISIKLIGIGKMDSIERMLNFLSSNSTLSIDAINFQMFNIDGKDVLIREMPQNIITPQTSSVYNEKTLREFASKFGTAPILDKALSFVNNNNLKFRIYKTSLMIAPPQNGNRCLFTIWLEPTKENKLKTYVELPALEQYFDIDIEQYKSEIGLTEFNYLTFNELDSFILQIEKLIKKTAYE